MDKRNPERLQGAIQRDATNNRIKRGAYADFVITAEGRSLIDRVFERLVGPREWRYDVPDCITSKSYQKGIVDLSLHITCTNS